MVIASGLTCPFLFMKRALVPSLPKGLPKMVKEEEDRISQKVLMQHLEETY